MIIDFADIADEIKSEMRPWTEVEVIISDIQGNIKYSDIFSQKFLLALSRFIKKKGPTFAIGDYYYIQNVSGVMLFKTSMNSMVILRTQQKLGILLIFLKILERIGLEIDILLGDYIRIEKTPPKYCDQEFIPREIPLFNIIAKPNSPNWLDRLQEEYDKLNYLYRLRDTYSTFSIYKQANSNRIFKCSFQGIVFDLRLSLQYPFVMPIADGFYFGRWFNPAGDHKNACLGILKNRWRPDGRMGIAHFIQLLGYYTSIANSKPVEFKVRQPRAINIHFY
ncbi:MAG: hypothetical protein ACTSRP_02395 [Candidatus Helarchaeota archaeon]